ncbi:MAG: hypothetical protein V7K25_01625 [Nostoc sp.]|uniref:hypothetical protein n=1 Tax=Nostoc sp. TaxID=1180 RepID=UPI002FFB6433
MSTTGYDACGLALRVAIGVTKTQFSKLAKTYSSNVVSLVRLVEAASLQYASLLSNQGGESPVII